MYEPRRDAAGRALAGEPMRYLLAVLTTDPECTAGQWLFNRSASGYAYIRDGRWNGPVHLLVCSWRSPKPFPGAQVRHLCGKGAQGCFSPRCLAWGTAEENGVDAARHGSHFGERNGRARLSKAQVAEIRRRYDRGGSRSAKGGTTQQQLADEFGVSQVMISLIVRGRNWSGTWA